MYSLYKDPEGENVFTTSKNNGTGISGINEQSRKISIPALDDSRATITLLQSQVEHLQAELKQYQVSII